MPGIGTLVNIATIFLGSLIGVFFNKLIPQKVKDTVIQGVGLAVILIGLSGAIRSNVFVDINNNFKLDSQYTLTLILSLVIGGAVGEIIDIEAHLDSFAKKFEQKLSFSGSFAQGFVTATLVFCVGAMAIVGSLEDGISHNPDTLIAKATLDGISSMIFSSTLGIGVMFSIFPVGIYQGLITFLAVFIAPFLTDAVIAQMSLVGSMLIFCIGLNMLNISKLKVGNLLPAIFMPPIFDLVLRLIK